jgi:hypothetical protein
MKNFFLSFIVTSFFLLTAFKVAENYVEQTKVELISTLNDKPKIITVEAKLEVPEIKIDPKGHESFLNKIGNFESGNNYKKVNRFGYMGRYQFHKTTLKAIDINVSRKIFLSSPELQEEAMRRLLTENKRTLKRFIRKYDGKIVHGVYVTESGILAAAHLGGAGNVMNWFRKGEDFKDGNGTPITRYMKVFSGYNLNLE